MRAVGAAAVALALGASAAAQPATALWADMLVPADPEALARCAGLTSLLARAATESPNATEADRARMGELSRAFLVAVDAEERRATGRPARATPDPSPDLRRRIGAASARYAATLSSGRLPGGHAAPDPYLRAELGLCIDALNARPAS